MIYVDGFVIPVPKKNVTAYRRMSRLFGKVMREHGALDYKEFIADDVKPGKWTSFPRAVKLKKNEVVFFAYVHYKSRKERDRIAKATMKDPRLAKMFAGEMLFDGKRIIVGGFKLAVSV